MTHIFDCSEARSVAQIQFSPYIYLTLLTSYIKILGSVLRNGSGVLSLDTYYCVVGIHLEQ